MELVQNYQSKRSKKVIRKGKGMMEGGLVEGEEASALVEWLSTMK